MACRDALGSPCTHRVSIHLRTVEPLGLGEHEAVLNAQRIYGAYGIDLQVVSIC
jgi:hypothetical protein